MPTGYTAMLEEENNPSFRDFAMRCARAFGVLVTMRDEPLDKEIPEEFKPNSYHLQAIRKATSDQSKIKNMTKEECLVEATKAKSNEVRYYSDLLAKQYVLIGRYKAMCAQIKAWTPPTKDHEGLKEFMLEQLDVSWPDVEYYERELQRAENITIDAAQWNKAAIERLEIEIKHHTKENEIEIERAQKRTEWLRKLRESLGEEGSDNG